MALKPKVGICITDHCTKMVVTDIRGLYEATDNPYGWNITGAGNPNVNRTDFASSLDTVVFKLKFPNQTTYYDLDVKAQVSGTATPNAYYLNYEFLITEIEMTDLSLTGKFPDGKYEYIYQLFDSATSTYYTSTGCFYSTCQTRCCVDKKLSSYLDVIKYGGCGCKDLKNYMMMKVYLDYGITSAVSQWNFTLADQLLAKAQKYCDFKNCNC